MQWLVDLVIAKLKVDGLFVNRGDPPANDFVLGDLTTDGGWHELDLSGIIPVNVHAVALQVLVLSVAVNKVVKFRTLGNVNDVNRSVINTQTAVIVATGDLVVIPNSDRKIEYNASPPPYFLLDICVKGWWF